MTGLTDIQKRLFSLQDAPYGDFQARLLPNLPRESIIGVRTPALRSLAKELFKKPETEAFWNELPHRYFEENQLHAFLLEGVKDYDACIRRLDAFLPYVDNWATCDQMCPKVLEKHTDLLLPQIRVWLSSPHPYTVRFAIGLLMRYYLDGRFAPEYPRLVASVVSEEYYINMMIAWYFATALAKQYESILPYLKEARLETWTHNKTIQKAAESYRISAEQKAELRALRR